MDRGPTLALVAVAYGLLPRSLQADVLGQIESAIIGFFTNIFNGISAFFGTIFQSIANVLAAIFQAPINAISGSWIFFQNWVAQYGAIAPLLTILMVAAFFIVGAVMIWLIVKFSTSEAEQTVEEAEEGV